MNLDTREGGPRARGRGGSMKNLYEDLANVGELAPVGTALAQLAESLAKGTPIEGRFELKDHTGCTMTLSDEGTSLGSEFTGEGAKESL